MTNETETTDILDDLQQMTGTDYVGRTAHRAAEEIERLRAALAEIVNATDAGAYFTARRAAGLAIGSKGKRLICQAPNLLAACQLLLEILENG